jgi:hypothetical protein
MLASLIEYIPAKQGKHALSATCCSSFPYLPAAHALHCDLSVAPMAELKVPLLHALHPVVASSADVPLSVFLNRPAAHAEHAAFPTSF